MLLLKQEMAKKRVSQRLLIKLLRGHGCTVDKGRMSRIVNDKDLSPSAQAIRGVAYGIVKNIDEEVERYEQENNADR